MTYMSSVPVQVAMIALVHSDMETSESMAHLQVLGNSGWLYNDCAFHSRILA